MSHYDITERRAGYFFILIFTLLAAGIITTSYFYYRHHEQYFRAQVENELSSIATLKVGELALWRNERFSDGLVLSKNMAFSAQVRSFLGKPDDPDARRQLQAWMSEYRAIYQFRRVSLFDADGAVRMSSPETQSPMDLHDAREILEIMRSGRMSFLDFHRHTPDGAIHLAVVIPIFNKPDRKQPLGVLALSIDPQIYLYPFISKWPIPTRTGETLLVRRDGNSALYLNDLKFRKNTALNLRVPLTDAKTPAVMAALGHEGIVEGVDYRGDPVIAAIKAVPGSPWRLVSKISESEVYEPLREHLWLVFITVGGLLLGAGSAVFVVWRQRNLRYYRERFETTEALRESEDKFRTLVEQIPGTTYIAVIDETSSTIYNSPQIEPMLGFSADEFLADPALWMKQLHPEDRERVLALVGKSGATGSDFKSEYRMIAHDGRTVWIRDDARVVRDKQGQSQLHGIMFDITERKRADERLIVSERELSNAQQLAHLGSWEMNIQTGKGIWSDESYRIFGFTPGAFEPEFDRFMGFIHPEDRKTIEDILHKILSGDLSQAEFDTRIIRPDGQERVVHDKLEVITDENGKLIKIIGVNFDIPERKRAEEALVQSERKYRSLFTNMRNGFAYCKMIFDKNNQPVDWIYLEVNDAFERVIGLKKETVEGKRVTEVFPTIKDFRPNLFEIYGQVALTGVGTEFTVNFDISAVWLSISVYCPQPGYFAAVFDDITERKRAEEILRVTQTELKAQNNELIQTQEELEAASAKYLNLYDFAPIGYFTISGQGLVLEANLTAANLLGMTRNHLIAQPFARFIVPEDQDIYYMFNRQPFETGKPRGCELRMERHHGGLFWARLEVTVAEDAKSGEPVWYTLMSDITKQVQVENALQKSEELHRVIMETANDAIICVDQKGKVCLWNRRAEEMFGYTAQEAQDKNVHDFITPEKYREQAHASFANFVASGEGPIINKTTGITALRRDGSEFPIELSVAAVKMKEGWGASAIVKNITVRREWERKLTETNEKLKKAMNDIEKTHVQLIRQEKLAALGQLAAGVAHEIKNPLNIIYTSAQLMMMEEGLPAEVTESGKIIMEQIMRAVKIIDGLRDFVRERKPETKEIDLCPFIEKTMGLVAYEMKGEGIEIEKECSPEPNRIMGDEDQLAQVFLNITNNARDSMNMRKESYSFEERERTGWKGRLTVRTRVKDGKANISFADNGIGISEENKRKLFTPFFTTKGETKGTGLGIAIAFGIIENHGGTIEFESEEGKGAVFTVTLPLAVG